MPATSAKGGDGRYVMVSGASYGVGRAVSRHLAQRGYRLLVTARRSDRLKDTESRILADGGYARAIPGDLRVAEEVSAVAQEVGQAAPDGIAGFVHCAFGHIGEEQGISLNELTSAQISEFVDVSVSGTINLTRELLPHLRMANGRCVFIIADWGLNVQNVLTSSDPGSVTQVGSEVFTAAKFAVSGFATALERRSQVRVSSIYPGVIASAVNAEYPVGLESGSDYLEIDSTRDEATSAGYDIPFDAIPLSDMAEAVHFCLTTEATVRSIQLKPSDYYYTGV